MITVSLIVNEIQLFQFGHKSVSFNEKQKQT